MKAVLFSGVDYLPLALHLGGGSVLDGVKPHGAVHYISCSRFSEVLLARIILIIAKLGHRHVGFTWTHLLVDHISAITPVLCHAVVLFLIVVDDSMGLVLVPLRDRILFKAEAMRDECPLLITLTFDSPSRSYSSALLRLLRSAHPRIWRRICWHRAHLSRSHRLHTHP